MPRYCNTLVVIVVYVIAGKVNCQCTFGATFNKQTWLDNTKGTLTFTATTMTGWSFQSVRSTVTSTINPTWRCVNHTDDNYLVLRTVKTFYFEPLSSSTAISVYAYMCLKLTQITASSFRYYQQAVQEINLGGERLKVSKSATLYQNDVCDLTVSIPTPEYHVIVHSGNASNARIQCPDSLLFIADYVFYGSDGTTACTGVGDSRMDVCSNTTQIEFNYTKCDQTIAFSGNGLLYCVDSVSYNGYDYTTVYNADASISANTRQFACFSVSGTQISIAPGNCTSYQNPFSFPLLADQTTPTGHRLVIQQEYLDCGTQSTSGGLTAGEIAAIVVSVLIVVIMWTTATICTIIFTVLTIYALQIFLVLLVEFTSLGDHIPRLKPVLPDVVNDYQHIDKEKLAVLESVVAASPSHIDTKGNQELDSAKVFKAKSSKKEETGKPKGERHKTSLEQIKVETKEHLLAKKPFKI